MLVKTGATAGVYCKDGLIGISTPYNETVIREAKRTGEARWNPELKKWIFNKTSYGLLSIVVVMQAMYESRGWKWFVPESAKAIFVEFNVNIPEEYTDAD